MLRRRSTVLGLGAVASAALFRPALAQKKMMTASTQLGWLRNGEFAPLMVAEVKGFFAEESIDHKLVDGGPGKNPIPIVAVGQAQFGVATSGLYLLAARTARDPVDVVAVGTLYQTTPSAYLTLRLPTDPDPTPKDLEGKVIGIQAGSEYVLNAIAKKNGVDESKIKVMTVQGNADPLLVGRIDFFSGWVTNQAYQIEQETAKPDAPPLLKGKTWKAIRMAEWGLNAYADTIFCTAQLTKENPDLVRGYLRAVARGVSFILSNPDEALRLVAKFPSQIENAEKLAWRWRVQNPLFSSTDTTKHGPLSMTAETWNAMGHFFKDADQVPRFVPAEEVMTTAFLPHAGAG
jgi:NitT/TauT family transport system substrate-binding protein